MKFIRRFDEDIEVMKDVQREINELKSVISDFHNVVSIRTNSFLNGYKESVLDIIIGLYNFPDINKFYQPREYMLAYYKILIDISDELEEYVDRLIETIKESKEEQFIVNITIFGQQFLKIYKKILVDQDTMEEVPIVSIVNPLSGGIIGTYNYSMEKFFNNLQIKYDKIEKLPKSPDPILPRDWDNAIKRIQKIENEN